MIIKISDTGDDFILSNWWDEYDEKKKKFKEVDICIWREGHHLIILNNSTFKRLHFRQGDIDHSDKTLRLREKLRKIIKKRKPRKANAIIIDLKESYD